ncbi:MAG: hypothetical protein Q4F00_05830 [bacterium]|nr:hypothetical protein [bacterium]
MGQFQLNRFADFVKTNRKSLGRLVSSLENNEKAIGQTVFAGGGYLRPCWTEADPLEESGISKGATLVPHPLQNLNVSFSWVPQLAQNLTILTSSNTVYNCDNRMHASLIISARD